MQLARLYDFGDIRIENEERPRPGPRDLLIRTRACGICSGDIMPWYLKRKAPVVLGHEPVGVVDQVGAEVRDFSPGDRVFVHHHAPCFECAACRHGNFVHCKTWRSTAIVPGGMAQFFVVGPENQRDTHKLETAISDFDAVLIEPAACVVKSLRRSRMAPGDTILVIGLGIMGMIHVRLARAFGAGKIIGADMIGLRARRAEELGADVGITVTNADLAEKVSAVTNGAMADVVIVGPGTPEAIRAGISAAGSGATVVAFTSTPPDAEMVLRPHDLYFKEISLVPSYSCGPDDIRQALQFVRSGVIKASDLVTHHYPLERISEAFATAQKPEALKVVVTFES
jgi:L-iditol 2-dehydrogenase